ncbi:hypothetical protein GCM10025858_11470 [Alicyclobacillus sacchari]|nr:hypothetical protein GCM10025858_11470 [Alicyclobacillus sacchari]
MPQGESNLCAQQGCIGFTRQGGFAEYVAVPHDQLVRRPVDLDPAAAAILVDAYATPQRALVAAGADVASTALVIGTGGLGLAAIQLLKASQVDRVASASGARPGSRRRMPQVQMSPLCLQTRVVPPVPSGVLLVRVGSISCSTRLAMGNRSPSLSMRCARAVPS